MVSFVGRQAELEMLDERLAEASAGRPQIALIQGEAGIGKTALLAHFVHSERPSAAATVLWASGEETEELLAFGVIEQLARAAASARPAGPEPAVAGGRADPPAGQAELGVIAELLSVHHPNPVDDPVAVGTRLLALIDRLAGPVILVIDDAQWADRPSMQALIFALRRLAADQVLTLVAIRDDRFADLPESLRRLIGGRQDSVVRLRGLAESDLRELATDLGIDDIGTTAARRLQAGTAGNPLYAKALLEEYPVAQWGPDDVLLPSPRSVRRLVQNRYAACDQRTRELIDAAAILGPHSALPLVAELARSAEPVQALDEAVRHDLLVAETTAFPWQVRFPHPLVRAALHDLLGPARRQQLHLLAAGLITDPATALRHRVAAAAGPDEELAADLTRFADQEARRQSWQSAAARLVSASQLSPHPLEAQRRVLQAVVWMMLRGDAATAATFAEVIRSFPPTPLRDAVLGSISMAYENPVAAGDLLSRAAAAMTSEQPADPEVAGIVALLTAIHFYGRLDAAATVTWCRKALEALSISGSSSADPLRAVALTYLVHGLGYAGRTAESIEAATSARERPGQDDLLWLNPRSARGVLRLVDDEFDDAKTDLSSAALAASKIGLLNTAAFSFAYLARAEWVSGAWDDALIHAERAAAIIVESDFGFMHSAVIGIAVLVPAGRGDWPLAQAHLQSMIDSDIGYERSVVASGLARARIADARGEPAAVIAALDPLRGFTEREAVDEPGFWPWQDLLADALVAVGRVAEASDFLAPHEKVAQQRGRRTSIARMARSRGAIEAAAGRTQQAADAFELALRSTDNLPVPFERARIELAAGRYLRRAGQRRRAADLLSAARERFSVLGASPYLQRCEVELGATGLTPTGRIDRDRASLTSQELVVSRLAAAGRSNREIAAELVVSVKTVEYHLRNAFNKLGITSRRQLGDRLPDRPVGIG
ncbi:MAG: AAA family ATPase [Nakamurella sp.]